MDYAHYKFDLRQLDNLKTRLKVKRLFAQDEECCVQGAWRSLEVLLMNHGHGVSYNAETEMYAVNALKSLGLELEYIETTCNCGTCRDCDDRIRENLSDEDKERLVLICDTIRELSPEARDLFHRPVYPVA